MILYARPGPRPIDFRSPAPLPIHAQRCRQGYGGRCRLGEIDDVFCHGPISCWPAQKNGIDWTFGSRSTYQYCNILRLLCLVAHMAIFNQFSNATIIKTALLATTSFVSVSRRMQQICDLLASLRPRIKLSKIPKAEKAKLWGLLLGVMVTCCSLAFIWSLWVSIFLDSRIQANLSGEFQIRILD
jgi:hypothetical protein